MHSRLVPLGLVALITAATLVGAARADVGGNVSGSGLGPVFEYGSLNMFPRGFVTAMVFGPDDRLYVATIEGESSLSPGAITALTLDITGTHVIHSEVIAEDTFTVFGLTFDPTLCDGKQR